MPYKNQQEHKKPLHFLLYSFQVLLYPYLEIAYIVLGIYFLGNPVHVFQLKNAVVHVFLIFSSAYPQHLNLYIKRTD